MSDQDPAAMAVYVLPTEEGLPPRAVIGHVYDEDNFMPAIAVVWTADLGCWTKDGVPIPQESSDLITEHAKSLGMDAWD